MPNVETEMDLSSRPVLSCGLTALGQSRWFLDKMLEGLSAEQMMARTCPGGNHAAWVVGHIALTEDTFVSHCTGQPSGLPEGWSALFANGTKPSDDASAYPSREELLRVLGERRKALTSWLMSLDEAALATKVEGDMAGLAPTFAQIGPALAFHEGVHAGQISAARRAAGLGPQF